MTGLTLTDVHKAYGDVVAVRGASFHVEAGQLAILVGPSGCGKTTTLRLIAGLERPDRGEIYLEEQKLGKLPSYRRNVAMVFQSPALYPHMTVQKNLAHPLRLQRTATDEVRRRVGHAATLLGLDDVLHRRPDELSGGQQQRVALGKAVVLSPRLWLFDEPLASLDAPLRRQLGRDIVALQKETGTTTLFVTHDQSEALAYADWLIVMDRGKVQQVGAPAEVYARPANRFVASFLGDPPMNLLSGEVAEGRFCAEGVSLALDTNVADGPLVIGIRPEDIKLAAGEAQSDLRAVVQRVEFRGNSVIAEACAGNQTLLVRSNPAAQLKAGTWLDLALPREKLHAFERNHEGKRMCGTP